MVYKYDLVRFSELYTIKIYTTRKCCFIILVFTISKWTKILGHTVKETTYIRKKRSEVRRYKYQISDKRQLNDYLLSSKILYYSIFGYYSILCIIFVS